MATEEDILLRLTQEKNKIPFDFERKERIENALPKVKDFYVDESTNLIDLLDKRLSEIGGKLVVVNNFDEFLLQLEKIKEENKIDSFVSFNENIINKLSTTNLEIYSSEEDLLKANASITLCDYVASRTGTILVSGYSVLSRRVISFPEIHIVYAHVSQLVYDMSEALEKFYQQNKDKFPSFVSFITGASKTADIEKTLIMGAHGPKKIYLFLSNNKIF